MVDVVDLARGVAEAIGAEADVELAPEFSLGDVKERTRIVVVPVGVERRMLARSVREDVLKVQVGVLRKATEDELVDLVSYVQTLALGLLHREVRGVRCVSAAHEPLFVPDHMRERRQFTGVVELSFREVCRHGVQGRI